MKIGKVFHDVAKEIDRGVDHIKDSMPKVDIHKDALQRFDSALNFYDRFLSSSESFLPDLPGNCFPTDPGTDWLDRIVEDRRVQAYIKGAAKAFEDVGAESKRGWEKVRPYAENFQIPFGGKEGTFDGVTQAWSNRMGADQLNFPDLVSNWGKGTALWEDEWHLLRLGEFNDQVSGRLGTLTGSGHFDVFSAQARVFVDGGLDIKEGLLTLSAGAQAKLELLGAHYNFGYVSPSTYLYGHEINFNANVGLDAFVGVQGTIEAAITLGSENDIQIGGDVFAGACASIQGSAGVSDYLGIHGEATAWAGIGAKGELALRLTNGELTFDMGFGAAFGIGAEYDWGFNVNFLKTGELLYDIAPPLWDDIEDARFSIPTYGDLQDGIGDVSNQWKDGMKDIGDKAGNEVKKAGKKLKKALGF